MILVKMSKMAPQIPKIPLLLQWFATGAEKSAKIDDNHSFHETS